MAFFFQKRAEMMKAQVQVAAALDDDACVQRGFLIEVYRALPGRQTVAGTMDGIEPGCFGELGIALEHGVAVDGQVLGALQQIVVRRAERLERLRQIGNLTQALGIRAEQLILIILRKQGHEIIERVIFRKAHRAFCAEHGKVFDDEKRFQIAFPHARQILIDRADADAHGQSVEQRVFFQHVLNKAGEKGLAGFDVSGRHRFEQHKLLTGEQIAEILCVESRRFQQNAGKLRAELLVVRVFAALRLCGEAENDCAAGNVGAVFELGRAADDGFVIREPGSENFIKEGGFIARFGVGLFGERFVGDAEREKRLCPGSVFRVAARAGHDDRSGRGTIRMQKRKAKRVRDQAFGAAYQRELIAQTRRFFRRGAVGMADEHPFRIEDARGDIHAAGDALAKRSTGPFVQRQGSFLPSVSSIYIKTKME